MRLYCDLFVVLTLVTLSHAQVRVWEGILTLPTYEEGMPDPNPPFDQFTNNKFNYPYVLRENLTSRRVNHDWRAIYLENEYLKCSALPDIGGHLYTCVDKISGQSMFYANTSIKKAVVGYRGAWAAFGTEFNFPVSHNWVSMSPVEVAFHNNADSSRSVETAAPRWSWETLIVFTEWKRTRGFQKALLLPDRMPAYHFTRMAHAEAVPLVQ